MSNLSTFITGLVLGSALTASVGLAGSSFYDKKGNVRAPRGSQESFDYFRARQQFLDIAAQRRLAESDRLHQLTKPCGK